ncbi:MAG: recombination protein O N-terminal domain-containing protein [Flavobacteriales bacterium]
MLVTTRAIVLRVVRHGDSSAVLKLYTEHHGLRGYAVRVGGKSGIAPALLGPLQRLVVVAQERGDRELHHLREVRPDKPFMNVDGDPVRGGVLLFLQEVLIRALHEESGDTVLFAFLQYALDVLDDAPDLGHYPIAFLAGLSQRLGFAPERPEEEAPWFDMSEGVFTSLEPQHPHAFTGPIVPLFAQLLQHDLSGCHGLGAGATARRALLEKLLQFYRLHVAGFGELRSPAVLHTVLG